MGMFKMEKPRRFNHQYIYVDERKEKLQKLEEKAKRDLGMLPPKEFSPEDIRGKFVEGTKHLKRRKESGRKPMTYGALFVAILVLLYILHYLVNDVCIRNALRFPCIHFEGMQGIRFPFRLRSKKQAYPQNNQTNACCNSSHFFFLHFIFLNTRILYFRTCYHIPQNLLFFISVSFPSTFSLYCILISLSIIFCLI